MSMPRTADEMNKSFYVTDYKKIPNIDIPTIETNSWTSDDCEQCFPQRVRWTIQ